MDALVEEQVPGYLHEVLVAWLVRVIGNWGRLPDIAIKGAFSAAPTLQVPRPDAIASVRRGGIPLQRGGIPLSAVRAP